jgi:hypothetical protein
MSKQMKTRQELERGDAHPGDAGGDVEVVTSAAFPAARWPAKPCGPPGREERNLPFFEQPSTCATMWGLKRGWPRVPIPSPCAADGAAACTVDRAPGPPRPRQRDLQVLSRMDINQLARIASRVGLGDLSQRRWHGSRNLGRSDFLPAGTGPQSAPPQRGLCVETGSPLSRRML